MNRNNQNDKNSFAYMKLILNKQIQKKKNKAKVKENKRLNN